MVVHYSSRIFRKLTPVIEKKWPSYALMLSTGLIHQIDTGVFAMLPLGQRVVDKLVRLVENELDEVGAQKCSFPILGPMWLWQKSDRWDIYGNGIYKLNGRHEKSYCLQPTCEELVSHIAGEIGVFKPASLPMMVYQLISEVYRTIFYDRLKLNKTMIVSAEAGEMGGELSHEYHLPNDTAQDKIRHCKTCCTSSIYESNTTSSCSGCGKDTKVISTIEIGHTFQLGTKYSNVFGAKNEKGEPYFMCCFGIGITRLIAACIDVLSPSTKSLRLPEAITPFKVALVLPKTSASNPHPALSYARSLIPDLEHVVPNDVLVEDVTSKSVGQRLHELNQLGVPHIFVVPAKKSALPHTLPNIEYFRALPNTDSLVENGTLSHAELFGLLRSL